MADRLNSFNQYQQLLDDQIRSLQNAASALQRAKKEINEDMNRLAVKSLPFMEPNVRQQNEPTSTSQIISDQYEESNRLNESNPSFSRESNSLESSLQREKSGDPANEVYQTLEPLDLDP